MKLLPVYFLILIMLCSSCISFSRVKKRFGKRSKEIVQVPFIKSIPSDSVVLQLNLKDLVPGFNIIKTGNRSSLSVNVDTSGGFKAQADCHPIVIHDSIPYEVEKLVFNEADFTGYVAKDEVKILLAQAKKQGIEEGKNKKGNFFDRIEDGLVQLFWIFIVIVLLIFVLRKMAEKSMNN